MTGPADEVSDVVKWHAVDGYGRALSRGRSSPAAAVASAPVVRWPLTVVGDDGSRVALAEALGPGGDRVAQLLDALSDGGAGVDVESLARATPAGRVDLPLAILPLGAAVEAATRVDRDWLAEVDRRRTTGRRAVVGAGRNQELEAALHVAVLVATERLDPRDDADVDEHVASGARLWLLAGAVVSALRGAHPDPFASWAELIAGGWWPVGPSDGRLVVSRSQ